MGRYSNGTTADSTHEKAECISSVFASNYCVSNSSLSLSFSVPTLPTCTQLLLDSVPFAPEKVEKFLGTLNSDSTTGPDGIGSHILNNCSAALALPLSSLFTLSFALGHLPSA